MRSLVHGFAIAGESTAVALAVWPRGPVTDDTIDSAKEQHAVMRVFARLLPDGDTLDAFVRQFDLIAPPRCADITASSNVHSERSGHFERDRNRIRYGAAT